MWLMAPEWESDRSWPNLARPSALDRPALHGRHGLGDRGVIPVAVDAKRVAQSVGVYRLCPRDDYRPCPQYPREDHRGDAAPVWVHTRDAHERASCQAGSTRCMAREESVPGSRQDGCRTDRRDPAARARGLSAGQLQVADTTADRKPAPLRGLNDVQIHVTGRAEGVTWVMAGARSRG